MAPGFEAIFNGLQARQDHKHDHRAGHGWGVEAATYGQSDACNGPKAGRRGQALDDLVPQDDRAGAQKPHAAHHLGGDPRGVQNDALG